MSTDPYLQQRKLKKAARALNCFASALENCVNSTNTLTHGWTPKNLRELAKWLFASANSIEIPPPQKPVENLRRATPRTCAFCYSKRKLKASGDYHCARPEGPQWLFLGDEKYSMTCNRWWPQGPEPPPE